MIVSILNVISSAEKHTEVSQTLASLAPLIRDEKGCLRCQFCRESEDDNAFTIVEEWRSREDFDEHLRSQVFSVLLGLAPLLKRPLGVSICTVVFREGMEAVRRARGPAVVH
jgi:quinol monooxygenase YgiN